VFINKLALNFGLKIITFKFVTPMVQRVILDKKLLAVTINRLCQQLIENHGDFSNAVIIGIQPRGVYLATKIQEQLLKQGVETPVGHLDITFYRDDFRRGKTTIKANSTKIDFLIEGKSVILIDDVLFTGRSVRASLDAINAFGRPQKVELLALIDRKYTRELPIQADYVGLAINSMFDQKVLVEWKGVEGATEDKIWLVSKEDN
jgi:pyrimidine operon attenuation protein / uracil phosphoribosyltransferase